MTISMKTDDTMSPSRRRLVYVLLFEGFGIVIAGAFLAAFSGKAPETAGIVAAVTSLIAMAWNYLFNTAFEAWEARRPRRGRPFRQRVAHAIAFEVTLSMLLVPFIAWWLDISLYQALIYDIGLITLFMAYTFAFNLGFDRVFGLPASAR